MGFSHPISDNTAFHFQYGHFYTQPIIQYYSYADSYRDGYRRSSNRNLEPPRTTSYEFGIQHNLMGTHRINVVMYFNEMDDQIGTVNHLSYESASSQTQYKMLVPMNISYATSKGVEFTIDRTQVGKWYYRFTYTMSRVFSGSTGPSLYYSFDPTDERNWTSRLSARSNLRGTDRTHRITGFIQFRSPKAWGAVAGDWDLSMILTVQSGRPYTYVKSYDESLANVGNYRMPLEQTTDVTFKKWITVAGLRTSFFLRVTNLFNSRHLSPFSSGSGINNTMNYWTDFNWMNTDPDNPGYKMSDYGYFYNETRRMFLGFGVSF